MIKKLQRHSFNGIYLFLFFILAVEVSSQTGPKKNLNYLLQPTLAPQEFFAPEIFREGSGLVAGQEKSLEIKSSQTQLHYFKPEAGQIADIHVVKEDFTLKAEVFAPDGKLVTAQLSKRAGVVKLVCPVETAGIYTLRISSTEPRAANKYSIIFYALSDMDASSGKDYLEAMNFFNIGEELLNEQNADAMQAASTNYQKALNALIKLKKYPEAAEVASRIGEVYLIFGNSRESLEFFQKAYDLSQATSEPERQMNYLNLIGRSAISLGKIEIARQSAQKVVDYYQRQDSIRTQNAYANLNLGEIIYLSGDLKSALEKFNAVIEISKRTGNRSGEFLGYLYVGHVQSDLGYLKEARISYQKSLDIALKSFDRRNEGLALTALGGIHSFYGEQDSAMNSHERALQLFRQIGDRKNQGVALNGLARVYEGLNQPAIAYRYYESSINLYRSIDNADYEASTLLSMGQLCNFLERYPEALIHYRRSFELSRILNKRRILGLASSFIAATLIKQKKTQNALRELEKSLQLFQAAGDRRGQIYFLDMLGDIYFAEKKFPQASENYQKSLLLSRQTGERNLEAQAFYKTALAARTNGQMEEALKNITRALEIIEALRVQVASEILRVSYFAAVNKYYSFYINLLMQLHSSAPGKGYETLALEASEKVRARTLLENISINKIEAPERISPSLVKEKKDLEELILSKSNLHDSLISEERALEEIESSAQEISELTIKYEKVQNEIKQNDQRLAIALPHTAGAAEVKSLLQSDADTCLLEYILTDEKSYLWVVTGSEIRSYELPARHEIEQTAIEFYNLLATDQSQFNGSNEQMRLKIEDVSKKAQELRRQLFPSVSWTPPHRRVLIVADGILNNISFDVLFMQNVSAELESLQSAARSADSSGDDTLLKNKHEIVNLPSISSLLALRRETTRRQSAPYSVIILADPIFESTDSRFSGENREEEELSDENRKAAFRTGAENKSDANYLARLPFTRREGRKILQTIPDRQGLLLTDFDAGMSAVTSAEIKNYQIIHFATHSIVNNEIPELSGIHLSNFKQNRLPVNGLLRLQDIYNLNLNSELVILSSCSTSLGKNVAGEGVMSLSRGFIVAGTKSVIASLWKVDDEATAKLMQHFYESLAQPGNSPSKALQIAKLKMASQKKWQHPYFWAGFVLQGEYKDTITFKTSKASYPLIAGVLLALIVGASLVVYRIRKRT
ncbi:MAG TPA: CHAT domain-containing protein [Pyrinomonadaceae bacterium]|jgi:CHAT domain-containing protein